MKTARLLALALLAGGCASAAPRGLLEGLQRRRLENGPAVSGVTPEEALGASRRHLDLGSLTVVAVGPADNLKEKGKDR